MVQAKNYFPECSGLYIAQRKTDVVLFKLSGMFPQLIVSKAIYLSSLIEGNSIKECPKEILENMIVFSEKWTFHMLDEINMDIFPKLAFKCDGNLDMSTEEVLNIKNTYYRLVQTGIAFTKIARSFMYEYKLTMKQVLELFNKFDKEKDVTT